MQTKKEKKLVNRFAKFYADTKIKITIAEVSEANTHLGENELLSNLEET